MEVSIKNIVTVTLIGRKARDLHHGMKRELPLGLLVFALRFQLLSLWYVDDSNFLLCHALNCKLWTFRNKNDLANV